tara:strand:- start:506 stop:832 length:327 start_codon:yes stop_codon:yes gene_type:complete
MDTDALLGILILYILPIGIQTRAKLKEGKGYLVSIISSTAIMTLVWTAFISMFFFYDALWDLLKTFDLPTFVNVLIMLVAIGVVSIGYVFVVIIVGRYIEKLADRFSK